MTTFTYTREAVAKGDNAQWAIGDALREDLKKYLKSGDSPESSKRHTNPVPLEEFENCSRQLAEQSYTYQPSVLSELLTMALRFPKAKRDHKLSWSIHRHAGTPEALTSLRPLLKKAGKDLTEGNVRAIAEEWRKRDKKERQTKTDEAKKKKLDAKKRKIGSKDPKVRADADRDIKDAEAAIKHAKSAPLGDPAGTPAPDPTEIVVLTELLTSKTEAKRLVKLLDSKIKQLQAFSGQIPLDTAATLIEHYTTIAERCNEIVKLLGGKDIIPHRHLRLASGGAA